jgi:hypothetical protein
VVEKISRPVHRNPNHPMQNLINDLAHSNPCGSIIDRSKLHHICANNLQVCL